MTTPTSRRRDVRASTAAAPAADEERSARFSPVLAQEREDGCRLLLLRYTSGEHPLPVPSSSHSDPAVSVSSASRRYSRALSLATPRGIQPREPLPTPSFASLVSLSRATVLSPFRSYETPVHHRRRYPTTGFPATPLEPLALCRAHPPARVTSQQRSPRPRAETDRESSALRQSAIRLAATLRHAARCVCFSAPRFKSLRAREALSRAPRTVNHRRGAISRGFERARPPQGAAWFNCTPLSVAVTDNTVREPA